jgi:hypothetical protein
MMVEKEACTDDSLLEFIVPNKGITLVDPPCNYKCMREKRQMFIRKCHVEFRF